LVAGSRWGRGQCRPAAARLYQSPWCWAKTQARNGPLPPRIPPRLVAGPRNGLRSCRPVPTTARIGSRAAMGFRPFGPGSRPARLHGPEPPPPVELPPAHARPPALKESLPTCLATRSP
jgi:hypothetical protein